MRSVNVLGILVSPVTMAATVEQIREWIRKGARHYVCVVGMHGVMESQKDEGLMRIHNAAGLVVPDGMPLVWLCRFSATAPVDRVYGPDLMLAVCDQLRMYHFRHFFLGGGPGVAAKLASRLTARYSGLQVAGTYSPSFGTLNADEEAQMIADVRQAKPDILWVGLGTPKQERFMAHYASRFDVPVLIGVGAAFDFHVGVKRQAPRWIRRCGFEWLFRLLSEPSRLWRRYLINIPIFLTLVALQLSGLKKFPESSQ
jgi:N-acetylglucosaminyldiphosphoundecaprenol N-acetyl-beta-D-mannosaminyltransferase